jgi:hypothetical protein
MVGLAAMRVKSRKPPAEYLMTSLWVTSSRSSGGAHDRVGDKVRQVAGDGEHTIVVRGIHDLDPRADGLPEGGEALDLRRSAPSGGVMMHQRPLNRLAKPASGPEFSVPATGWAGMMRVPRPLRPAPRPRLATLLEPTSEITASGRSAGRARGVAHGQRRHAEDHQIGAGHRLGRCVATWPTRPRSAARARVSGCGHSRWWHGGQMFAQGKADGAAQQAQPDDRNLGKGASLMRCVAMGRMAAAISSICAALPMVMRSASAGPDPGSQRVI